MLSLFFFGSERLKFFKKENIILKYNVSKWFGIDMDCWYFL